MYAKNREKLSRSVLSSQVFKIIIILHEEPSIIKNFYHIYNPLQNKAFCVQENPKIICPNGFILRTKKTNSKEEK